MSDEQKKVLEQEREARFNMQKALLNKGGLGFLLKMFNKIKKDVDFDKEVLISKTLQILISVLDRLHTQKFLSQLSQLTTTANLVELMTGCLVITNSYLQNMVIKLDKRFNELFQRQKQLNQHEKDSSAIDTAYSQLQEENFDSSILTSCLNFIFRIFMLIPTSFPLICEHPLLKSILEAGLIRMQHKKI